MSDRKPSHIFTRLTMPPSKRKKRPTRSTILSEPMITLYRRIYLGEWAHIKPAALLKVDPRFEERKKNLSRTIISAKEKIARYRKGQAGE